MPISEKNRSLNLLYTIYTNCEVAETSFYLVLRVRLEVLESIREVEPVLIGATSAELECFKTY